jgi:hypothetical protein
VNAIFITMSSSDSGVKLCMGIGRQGSLAMDKSDIRNQVVLRPGNSGKVVDQLSTSALFVSSAIDDTPILKGMGR